MMDSQNIFWQFDKLDNIHLADFYKALSLRQDVFIIEQECLYRDIDGLDDKAWHLFGWDSYTKEKLATYARIFAPGDYYTEAAIGRILTAADFRRGGFGVALMEESIRRTDALFDNPPIRMGAQTYLIDFYGKFGFKPDGDRYDEDGIEHVHMLRAS